MRKLEEIKVRQELSKTRDRYEILKGQVTANMQAISNLYNQQLANKLELKDTSAEFNKEWAELEKIYATQSAMVEEIFSESMNNNITHAKNDNDRGLAKEAVKLIENTYLPELIRANTAASSISTKLDMIIDQIKATQAAAGQQLNGYDEATTVTLQFDNKGELITNTITPKPSF